LEALPRVGGVATYVENAVLAAKKLGLGVKLAAPRGSTHVDIPLDCDHGQMPFNLWRAGLTMEKLTAPVVYLAEAAAIRASLWIWDWTKKQKIRLVLHGSEILELEHSMRFHELLRRAEKIYTLSRVVAEMVLRMEPSVKVTLTGGAPNPNLTEITGLHDPHRLITVGRLHPRKGQETVIHAMKEGALPGFSYEVAGPSRRGGYAVKIRKLVAAQKLPVNFAGEVPDRQLSLLYAQAGIFVLPAVVKDNRIEGYGLSLLDAAAMGLPAVAYDSGGISEVIQHGRTGLLVPPGDRNALVDAILQISANDQLCVEMSEAAREWASSKSWEQVADKLFMR
jgi:phosphatidylinositol alpha-1,6-mannosyltransferase